MALLANLKLVSAKRNTQQSPVVQRRNKLITQLHEQIQLARAVVDGGTYAPTKQKKVKNTESGEQVTLTVPKRVKQWWWIGDNGKLQLAIRYGARPLALNAKGANAIELQDTAAVLDTLLLVKQAVEAGELDAAIEAVSKTANKAAK